MLLTNTQGLEYSVNMYTAPEVSPEDWKLFQSSFPALAHSPFSVPCSYKQIGTSKFYSARTFFGSSRVAKQLNFVIFVQTADEHFI